MSTYLVSGITTTLLHILHAQFLFATTYVLRYLILKTQLEPVTPVPSIICSIWLVAHGIQLDKWQAFNTKVCDRLVCSVCWEKRHGSWLVWCTGQSEIGDVALERGGDGSVDWELDAEILLVWTAWVVESCDSC